MTKKFRQKFCTNFLNLSLKKCKDLKFYWPTSFYFWTSPTLLSFSFLNHPIQRAYLRFSFCSLANSLREREKESDSKLAYSHWPIHSDCVGLVEWIRKKRIISAVPVHYSPTSWTKSPSVEFGARLAADAFASCGQCSLSTQNSGYPESWNSEKCGCSSSSSSSLPGKALLLCSEDDPGLDLRLPRRSFLSVEAAVEVIGRFGCVKDTRVSNVGRLAIGKELTATWRTVVLSG